MNEDDFPAAHSMDSVWFAVDAEGRVVIFSTGEVGAMLEDAVGGEDGNSDLYYAMGTLLKKGEEIIGRAGGDEQSYEYPIGSGVTISAPETPFNQLQPNPITIAQLGDGSAAIDLLRQAGLL